VLGNEWIPPSSIESYGRRGCRPKLAPLSTVPSGAAQEAANRSAVSNAAALDQMLEIEASNLE
jgi:hypothetical protein